MKITRRQLQELIRSVTLDEGPGHKSDPRGPDAPAPGGAVNVQDRDFKKGGAPSEIDLARGGRLGGRTGDAMHHQDTKGKGAGGFPGTPQERLKGSGGTQEPPPPAEVEGPEIDYTKGHNPVRQSGEKPLKTKNESVCITRKQLRQFIQEAAGRLNEDMVSDIAAATYKKAEQDAGKYNVSHQFMKLIDEGDQQGAVELINSIPLSKISPTIEAHIREKGGGWWALALQVEEEGPQVAMFYGPSEVKRYDDEPYPATLPRESEVTNKGLSEVRRNLRDTLGFDVSMGSFGGSTDGIFLDYNKNVGKTDVDFEEFGPWKFPKDWHIFGEGPAAGVPKDVKPDGPYSAESYLMVAIQPNRVASESYEKSKRKGGYQEDL